jgi:beta-fructofuranosidase
MSTDMVYWERLPVALYNDEVYDSTGVFSGSTTIVDGIPNILYTCVNGTGAQLQCLATPADPTDPSLEVWEKSASNPIIDTVPSGGDIMYFR